MKNSIIQRLRYHTALNRLADVKDFYIDGVVLLSSRLCEATSISNLTIQNVLRNDYEIPRVVLEADHSEAWHLHGSFRG